MQNTYELNILKLKAKFLTIYKKNMTIVYHENRVWVRISSACSSKCIMCLDGDQIKLNKFISENIVKKQITQWFKPWMKNKIIISGWEASINPKFFDYIKYAKEIGYNKIQTVTNGLRWADLEFCRKAVNAGLTEITFSLHWYNSQTHDYITQTPWSFKKLIKAILNFRKYFPQIIVNADIVVSKININYAYKIVELLKKLDVWEYDILQVIPFSNAWLNKNKVLFEDIFKYFDKWQLIRKQSEDTRVHMWANRVFPQLLQWYEHMIQSPEKIWDETMGEWKSMFVNAWKNQKRPICSDKLRCKNCYLQRYCSKMEENFNVNHRQFENKSQTIWKKIFRLESSGDIFWINNTYSEKAENFINLIREKSKNVDKVVNIPYCIVSKNNEFSQFNEKWKTVEDFTNWFINEWFRIKWLDCKNCKFNEICDGIHINFVKKYWFKILNPVKD